MNQTARFLLVGCDNVGPTMRCLTEAEVSHWLDTRDLHDEEGGLLWLDDNLDLQPVSVGPPMPREKLDGVGQVYAFSELRIPSGAVVGIMLHTDH